MLQIMMVRLVESLLRTEILSWTNKDISIMLFNRKLIHWKNLINVMHGLEEIFNIYIQVKVPG